MGKLPLASVQLVALRAVRSKRHVFDSFFERRAGSATSCTLKQNYRHLKCSGADSAKCGMVCLAGLGVQVSRDYS